MFTGAVHSSFAPPTEPLDEYEKLVIDMNTPRVVVDNAVCPTATVVQVDSVHRRGVLLEAVQALADLDLMVNKAYISSDGRWFMDVFHVTDALGRKLTDDSVVSYIEQSLGGVDRSAAFDDLTALELVGTDRPGLLSEIFAVLADLHFTVGEARAWTHRGQLAVIIFLQDVQPATGCGGCGGCDSHRLGHLVSRLRHLLNEEPRSIVALSPATLSHADRRLHQLLSARRDFHRPCRAGDVAASAGAAPSVSVQDQADRGYSVVAVECRDRPKLLFDVVCTLTDMGYAVFHGTVDTDADADIARQEFYVRHADGDGPISSEAERQRVVQCVLAAVERRGFDGLRVELCAADRAGLLADVTRSFRESGLVVTQAEVSTKSGKAFNVFYITDAAGRPADPAAVDAVAARFGEGSLTPRPAQPLCRRKSGVDQTTDAGYAGGLFYLGSFVRRNLFYLRDLYYLGLIKSCS